MTGSRDISGDGLAKAEDARAIRDEADQSPSYLRDLIMEPGTRCPPPPKGAGGPTSDAPKILDKPGGSESNATPVVTDDNKKSSVRFSEDHLDLLRQHTLREVSPSPEKMRKSREGQWLAKGTVRQTTEQEKPVSRKPLEHLWARFRGREKVEDPESARAAR